MKSLRLCSFVLTVVLLSSLVPGRSVLAQRATSRNNNISLDFVDFLVDNAFSGQYESKLTPTSSFLIRAEYVIKSTTTSAANGKTTAFGFGGDWRFYILDSRALQGFSVAPAFDVYFFKNLIRSNVLISVGGDGAYKFFFDQFTVEPTIGLRFGITPGGQLPEGESSFTGVYPRICVYLGYAW